MMFHESEIIPERTIALKGERLDTITLLYKSDKTVFFSVLGLHSW